MCLSQSALQAFVSSSHPLPLFFAHLASDFLPFAALLFHTDTPNCTHITHTHTLSLCFLRVSMCDCMLLLLLFFCCHCCCYFSCCIFCFILEQFVGTYKRCKNVKLPIIILLVLLLLLLLLLCTETLALTRHEIQLWRCVKRTNYSKVFSCCFLVEYVTGAHQSQIIIKFYDEKLILSSPTHQFNVCIYTFIYFHCNFVDAISNRLNRTVLMIMAMVNCELDKFTFQCLFRLLAKCII